MPENFKDRINFLSMLNDIQLTSGELYVSNVSVSQFDRIGSYFFRCRFAH